jgi:tRNA A-37 threonylcarbamoyl transferase component Bud32
VPAPLYHVLHRRFPSAGAGAIATVLDERLSQELLPELEIIRRLGDGSTAHVYLAREPALRRLVAVKVLRPDLAADAIVRQRFEREAQSAARIAHPHVTAVHRIGRLADDVPYMVMEYVDGRTVRDVLDARGAFEPDEARRVLAAVASALATAHEKGIVHRDVRPANVFIEHRTGRAVLGDFGIAALLESGSEPAAQLTAVGVRLGEVRYMSPEQVRGEPVTELSDMYAFGILAYEVLTGQGPYDAASDARMLAAHLDATPRRLHELRADIDPATAHLIEACLARDPARRPTAADIAGELTRPPGTARTASSGEPRGAIALFFDELRRRRIYQMLVGYGAVALAVLGGASAVFDAFELPAWAYRALVAATLAGFPVALVLAWIFDITASGIRRTRSATAAPDTVRLLRRLKWLGLFISIVLAAALGWWLLGRG